MLKVASPAKINLFLRILRKREDGYHDLASLFQTISLFDYLTFQRASSDIFTCSDPKMPLNDSNLVCKSLQLFRKSTGISSSFHIHLEKNIPVEAGLGGGSSNAAFTLLALNTLSGSPMKREELALLGQQLGSDVPFFFSSGSAYCTGRGEIIQEVVIPPITATLCKPAFGCATPAVYRALDLNQCSSLDPLILLNHFQKGELALINDLELAAMKVSPALIPFKKSLIASGYSEVLMSGSGAAYLCFGKAHQSPPCSFIQLVSSIQINN